MKMLACFLLASLALSDVLALPARSPSDDAEFIKVPNRRVSSDDDNTDTDFRDFKGLIDTGAGYPFLQPRPHSFSLNLGFFDSFDDIFRRLYSRLLPRTDIDDDSSTDEVGFPFAVGPKIDPKKANTTSTVKIIGGNRVEVNETVYGDDNNQFRVRIVNIAPVNDGEADDDVEQTDEDGENGDTNAQNHPATSGPVTTNTKENDDSNERREPLESDNEVRGNIDDPEVNI